MQSKRATIFTQEPKPEDFEMSGDTEYPQAEAAKMLGMHRVTLLRLEQMGKLMDTRNKPPTPWTPRWRRLPQPHRVYTSAEIDMLRAQIVERAQQKKGDDIVFLEDEK